MRLLCSREYLKIVLINLKALKTPTNEVFFDGQAFDNKTEDVAKKLVSQLMYHLKFGQQIMKQMF